MSQYYFSNNTNSFNTSSFNRELNSTTAADDRSQILAWLSPLEPRLRHQDIQERRVQNIGEWLLKTEEFGSWYTGSGGNESENAVLFCYGDPGVGKTYISSLVVDSLCDRGQDVAVACFYFDFAARKEQSSTNVLGALLKQAVSGLEQLPEEIVREYTSQGKVIGGRGLRLPDIVKMLQTTSSQKRTFICIDALDECVVGHRATLLESLNQILRVSPGTRIFVTGRPYIRPEIERGLSRRVTSVPVIPKRGDMISYLHARLNEDAIPDAMDHSLVAEILKKIPEEISETFLLVSLNIEAILRETTIYGRRQRLHAMTDGLGLGDAYDATLDRIKGQGEMRSRLGMAALMWISHSERPLKPDELCHALAVEIGSPNLNDDNVPSIGTLLGCCQGLLVVDKETFMVRLVHFTLQEYLSAHPEFFGTAHSTMAETCLSFLNFQKVRALSTGPPHDLQGVPFLEYSSLYWGVHAKRDLSDCAKQLALKLFDDYNNHISTEFFLKAQEWCSHAIDFDKPTPFSGLHCASAFGIVEIVSHLVEVEGCDINQEDYAGNTALVWAALNGHEGAVETLLVQDDVNPSKPNKYGQTPLFGASWGGHEGVMKTLLGREDVNPEKPDVYGQTPLFSAAWNGHEGAVKILLEREGVDPNKPDNRGQTPLFGAAWKGHARVVKILLGRKDVDPDKPDVRNQAPLFGAAENGHEGVVKILLGRPDVNPGKLNEYGQTPLFGAAWKGHEGVVKILLGRNDVNPDKSDAYGQTPLFSAAENGHEGVVKILLGCEDVNPDKPDNRDQTPLFGAAWNGHEGVVKILLEQGDVNPDKSDNRGQTPLFGAAWGGHERVVRTLLGRDDVKPDKPDGFGRTPLWWAATAGHAGVVALLRHRVPRAPSVT